MVTARGLSELDVEGYDLAYVADFHDPEQDAEADSPVYFDVLVKKRETVLVTK